MLLDKSLTNKDIDGSFRTYNPSPPVKRPSNIIDDIAGSRSRSRRGFIRREETNPLLPIYDSEKVDYSKKAQTNLMKFIDKATNRLATLINKTTAT